MLPTEILKIIASYSFDAAMALGFKRIAYELRKDCYISMQIIGNREGFRVVICKNGHYMVKMKGKVSFHFNNRQEVIIFIRKLIETESEVTLRVYWIGNQLAKQNYKNDSKNASNFFEESIEFFAAADNYAFDTPSAINCEFFSNKASLYKRLGFRHIIANVNGKVLQYYQITNHETIFFFHVQEPLKYKLNSICDKCSYDESEVLYLLEKTKCI